MSALTKAQAALVATVEADGEAWVVPAQMNMARELHRRGLLRLMSYGRMDERRRIWTRCCLRVSP